MRFAIVGTGGLGGYYGARLAAAGHEVAFIARGEQLAAIRAHGLRVLSPVGDLHLEQVRVTDSPAEVGEVDAVLVAVKTWQVPEAAQAMAPMVGRSTVVVPFLNGVEAPDQLARVLGSDRVLGGLSKIFSMIEAPGVVRHFSAGAYTEIGELDGSASARCEGLREALESAGIETVVSDDIRTALWKKLVIVSSWSGLGALARSPIGVMRSRADTRALIDRAIGEGIAVGRALGHRVDDTERAATWAFYDAMPSEATSSMLRDILVGKPSELDAWNGAVVRYGREHGVETPIHGYTYALLSPMERRARGELDEG